MNNNFQNVNEILSICSNSTYSEIESIYNKTLNKFSTICNANCNSNNNIHSYLISLKTIFHYILHNNLILALNTYEPQLKKYENTIRYYTKLLTQYRLQKESYENKLIILLKKEKEYEKIKLDKNICVENGEIIYSDQKENEIIILHAENSNLKNILLKYESQLKDMQCENLQLKQEIKSLNTKIYNNNNIQNNIQTNSDENINSKNNSDNKLKKTKKRKSNINLSQRSLKSSSCYHLNIHTQTKNKNCTYDETNPSYCYSHLHSISKNKGISSPYKRLISSFNTFSRTNESKLIPNCKKTIINNKRKKKFNSIKNLFVTTSSMINNYYIFKNYNKKYPNSTTKGSKQNSIIMQNNQNNNNQSLCINGSNSGTNNSQGIQIYSKAETARYQNK